MSVKTVWRATTPEQNKKDRTENAKVIVTEKEPEGDEFTVIYELHVPETDLQETGTPGQYEIVWSEIDRYPFQVRYQ